MPRTVKKRDANSLFERKPLISILIPTLNGGGAERSMVQLANGLASSGFCVQLVTALNADGPYRSEIADNVNLVNLNARRFRYFPIALHKYMIQNHPDIVVTALMNNWVLLMKKLMRYPAKIIASERNHFSRSYQNKSGLFAKGTVWASHRLYPTADRIVAVSAGVADDLSTLGLASKSQLRMIYNPVINEVFSKMLAEEPDASLLRHGVANFIAAGRFAEQKGYPVLLRAFALVRKECAAHLLVLGDGPLRPLLEKTVEELGIEMDVSFPGFIRNPFPHMARADCFVLPSLYEGLPGVLIQALGCGTTVVATDCLGGNSEILENGKYGTLVPVGDVKALAEGMIKSIKHPFPSGVLKRRAEMFNEKQCVDAYIRLFDELTGLNGG